MQRCDFEVLFYLHVFVLLQQGGGQLLNLSLQLPHPQRETRPLSPQLGDRPLFGLKLFRQLLDHPERRTHTTSVIINIHTFMGVCYSPCTCLCLCLCLCWLGTGGPQGGPLWWCPGGGGGGVSPIQPVMPSALPHCALAGPPAHTHTHRRWFYSRLTCTSVLVGDHADLLQELNLGLQQLLHVIDLLLLLLTASLQRCLIAVGRTLRCCSVKVQTGKQTS